MITRQIGVLMHRYAGLVMAMFLVIAGITGSLLAWNDELEALIAPQLFVAKPPTSEAEPIDPLTLREHVLQRYPATQIRYVSLYRQPNRAAVFAIAPLARDNEPTTQLANDQVFVDPYSGAFLGERKWGDIAQGSKNLMPFLYRLHYSLALGIIGEYVFGIVALLWTLDCFIGAYLTFPPRRKAAALARVPVTSWLSRWRPAWSVRWRGGSYKVNFDLHRAGGLWPWAMLLVVAWSGVAFNLREVYDPLMRTVFAYQLDENSFPSLAQPQYAPPVSWRDARIIGRTAMAQQARERGFTIEHEDSLVYDAAHAVYRYDVRSDRDIRDHQGNTSLYIDADSGKPLTVWLPSGGAAGDTIRLWLTSLHMAALWGTPFKVFICILGVAVATLSATGMVIWVRKRKARSGRPR